jgi:hypothetical protein
MKKITIFLFLLFFTSCSESKKVEVFEINLLENIEKYISINNYSAIENEYSGKNKKYSTIDIVNSSNLFKNKEFDLVQITIDNKNNKIHNISQIRSISSGVFQCDKFREDVINQFKAIYKINLNDQNIVSIIKQKQANKDNIYSDNIFFYNKKDKYIFSLQCLDLTKSIVKTSNNYEFRVERTTRELNDWLLDSKKSKIIDK